MRVISLAVTATSAASLLWASSAFAADWKLVEANGVVRVAAPGRAPVAGAANQTVPVGSVVTTAAGGRAALLNGEQRITLGPNSRMTVAPEQSGGVTRIMQDLGSALFQVDKKPSQHFRVETPLLAAIVKGTTFTVSVDVARDSVHVAEGLVEVRANQGGALRDVGAGATAVVAREAPAQLDLTTPSAALEPEVGPAPVAALDYSAVSGGLIDGPGAPAAPVAALGLGRGGQSTPAAVDGAPEASPPSAQALTLASVDVQSPSEPVATPEAAAPVGPGPGADAGGVPTGAEPPRTTAPIELAAGPPSGGGASGPNGNAGGNVDAGGRGNSGADPNGGSASNDKPGGGGGNAGGNGNGNGNGNGAPETPGRPAEPGGGSNGGGNGNAGGNGNGAPETPGRPTEPGGGNGNAEAPGNVPGSGPSNGNGPPQAPGANGGAGGNGNGNAPPADVPGPGAGAGNGNAPSTDGGAGSNGNAGGNGSGNAPPADVPANGPDGNGNGNGNGHGGGVVAPPSDNAGGNGNGNAGGGAGPGNGNGDGPPGGSEDAGGKPPKAK